MEEWFLWVVIAISVAAIFTDIICRLKRTDTSLKILDVVQHVEFLMFWEISAIFIGIEKMMTVLIIACVLMVILIDVVLNFDKIRQAVRNSTERIKAGKNRI